MTGPGQRGYVASASETEPGGFEPYKAFNDIVSSSGANLHHWSADNVNYSTSSGDWGGSTAANHTTNVEGTSKYGDWCQIELPHKLKYSYSRIRAPYHAAGRQPREGYIVGSNDLSGQWTILHNFSGVTRSAATDYSTYTPPSAPTQYFKYIRIVIEKLGPSPNGNGYAGIDEWELYGVQEDTETPLIVGGPFAGKVANFRVYDQYLGDERIQEIYDAQKDEFGHKKSSMTFYKGRVGVGTTEPEGALTVIDEPHALERFPATDLASNDTYIDGQGIIKVRSSYQGEDNRSLGAPDHALRTDVHAYRAFKGDRNWKSLPERNTRMSEEVDFGAWLKIQTPQSMSLKKAEIESNPYWQQVGTRIDGVQANARLGASMALSDDGTRLVAGAWNSDGTNNSGAVYVYDWNGSAWTRVGSVIGHHTVSGSYNGWSVSISGDGNTVAVGSRVDSPGADSGSVTSFTLVGATWTLKGAVIATGVTGDLTGYSLSRMSTDGNLVAFCDLSYDKQSSETDLGGVSGNTHNNAGRVRVFKYENGAWSQRGSSLIGELADDQAGRDVQMSEDGKYLIFGTSYTSKVYIFEWNGTDYIKRGSTITGVAGDFFGRSTDISKDGSVIAIGYYGADEAEGALAGNSGLVQMYKWNGTNAYTLTSTLTSNDTDASDQFGTAVYLSSDGKRLVVGADSDDAGGTTSGIVCTFESTDGSKWLRREPHGSIGTTAPAGYIIGRETAVYISRDGSTIGIGEYGSSTGGTSSGSFRVFSMPSNIKSIWGSNDDVNWTKITTGNKTFRGNDRLEFKNLDNPNYYKYHAIVADAFTTLKNIRLYGIREKASSTIHDGALTLTKNLVVPRIGPAFDADDTPRRDRLVVEYTTSTNPTDYGYVKDTSGNGYDAKMVGVVYNPSDKSFECSASDGSQWIETQIPNGSRFNTQFTVSVWANMGQFNLTSLYGFIFALGDRNQTGLSSTSGNEISLVYNHAGLTEGTFFAGIEGANLIFKEWTTHDSHMGQWYHLTITYDGSTLYVYKNGENSGYAARTAPVLPDDNCVVRLFGDAVNENATHQGVQSRISNFKLYDCCLTRDEVRTLYDMGRCDEGHHVVSFEKTRVGIGLGDGCAPKADLDVRGRVRIGPSGQQWRTSGDDGDRLIEFHSGQATSGQPTLEVTHHGGTRVSPTPTVLQISNELGGGSDWSTTEPYALLAFANSDGSGSGVAGPAASVGAVCDTVSGGGDTRLAFFTNSGIDHVERMCVNHDGNVGIGTTLPSQKLDVNGHIKCDRLITGPNSGYWTTMYIGTGSSSARLYLRGTSDENHVTIFAANSSFSDDRLKTDEELITDATDTLMKLSVQKYKKYDNFDLTGSYKNETGLIAQDIWYNAPELRHIVDLGADASGNKVEPLPLPGGVNTTHDIQNDPDYNALGWGDDEAGVLYAQLIPYLIKSNQEIYTELQAEKAKVTTLETQLTSVLTRLDALENA
jgi:hypothetical protein